MPFNKARALAEAERLVSQKKYAQAIKQYLEIIEKDPKDFALLNTAGDLCVREGNIRDALRLFNRLGEAYVAEGFRVKAIAIYKKISKLDPQAVDPLLKLGELYAAQKLMREAREQYAQAFEMCAGKNKVQALEVMRRLAALDPENTDQLGRLAQAYEAAGRRAEAAEVYAQVADLALRRGDRQTAEPAARKAEELGAGRLELQFMRARLAVEAGRPEELEQILAASPELASDPAMQELRLRSCLASGDLAAARELALEMFRAQPNDFTPLASFCAGCREAGELDLALETLASLAEEIVKEPAGPAEPLLEALRSLWSARPLHIPTLELILRLGRATADETMLPEVLEALGHAYVQAGRLEEAETAYRELVELEPESEANRALLHQVLQKAGKAPAGESAETASEPEASPEPAFLVEEALESSELYSRYGLVDKAVAELEKVLAVYPDRIEIHKRILDLCQEKNPARAARAAEELCRLYTQQNSPSHARSYAEMARRLAGASEESTLESASAAGGPPPAEAAGSAGVAAPVAAAPPAPEVDDGEWDLSAELETGAEAPLAEPPEPPLPPPPFDLEEQRTALRFYLEYGFLDEAREALLALERKFPGDPHVAALRQTVEEQAPVAAPAMETPQAEAAGSSEAEAPCQDDTPSLPEFSPSSARPAAEAGLATAALVAESVAEATEDAAVGSAPIAEELSFPAPAGLPFEAAPESGLTAETEPQPSQAGDPERGRAECRPAGSESLEVEEAEPEPEPAPMPCVAGSELPAGGPAACFGRDASGLEAAAAPEMVSLPGLPVSAAQPRSSEAVATPALPRRAAGSSSLEVSLRSLLADLGPAEDRARRDDAETHYHLGVAFREMELYDEAISEFQKVVKGARKDRLPPRFLQTCSQLAHCFMEKRLPSIAIKWYLRALEAPDLDEDARLALKYELGVAYEQAGSNEPALENYLEVYGQNIEYRDVAERIRLLQQKAG